MPDFPQVPESDAVGETASLYAALRQATGVPTVNLIWRHFAALPGVLGLVWEALAPLLGSAELDAARTRIAAGIDLPDCGPAELDTAGVDDAVLPQVAAIVAAYNLGNLTNVVALTGLRLRLEQPGLPMRRAPFTARPVEPVSPLPALPRLDTLPAPVATSVHALAARHDGAGEGVIPSLYLALTPWPGLLAALPDWLAPLYLPEVLCTARTQVVERAEAEAAAVLPSLSCAPDALNAARPVLRRFTTLMIPDMVPIGLALHSLLRHGR
jgi:hypothetical protein